MSANIKASVDGTQAIIGVGGVEQMTVSNAGVVTANSFVGAISNTNVTATGSTTARTLANRFADVVNVKDFGAVGDGVTDDTAAIQAAYNSSGTKASIIFWPKGEYKTSSSIIVKSNTKTLFDFNAYINPVALSSFTQIVMPTYVFGYAIFINQNFTSTGIFDYNIEYDGVRIIAGNKDFVWYNGVSWNGHGVDSRNVNGLTIRNCYFQDIADGCGNMNCYNVVVENNKAYNISNSAYDFWEGCNNVIVSNNFAFNSNNGCNWNAVDTQNLGSLTAQNAIIKDNYFEGGGAACIYVAPLNSTASCQDVKIINNILDQNFETMFSPNGITVARSNNILIKGNTIKRIASNGVPINVNNDGSGNSYNVEICNNNILNCSLVGNPYIGAWGTENIVYENTSDLSTTTGPAIQVDSSTSIVGNNNLIGSTFDVVNATSTGTPTSPSYQHTIDKTNNYWFYKQKVKTDIAFLESVDYAITSIGTNLGTAYPIQKTFNYVSSGVLNSGVAIPLASQNIGRQITIFNQTGNTIKVYSQSGDVIDSSTSVNLSTSTNIKIVALTAGFWKTL